MCFKPRSDFYRTKPIDYLCATHKNFDEITKYYPNRVENGNERRSLLTPELIASYLQRKKYENVKNGNEKLAKHRNYRGYSDAESGQYILKTYGDVTQAYANVVISAINKAKDDLENTSISNEEISPEI